MIHERHNCRACASTDLEMILDLGKTALANDFLSPAEVAGYRTSLPLRVKLCRQCSLLQLAEVVDPGVLYSRYAYVTSTSHTMDTHLSEQRDDLLQAGAFAQPPRVVEIASNTGLYLKKFQERGCEVLGVEPARNIAELAEQAGVRTWTDFFNAHNARTIRAEWGAADLVLGRHVFAHIDDWQDLVKALDAVAHEGSLIGLEVPYLRDFFEHTEYDTIYHEHLSYVSVRSVEALLEGTPFRLQAVKHYAIHGGSVLLFIRRRTDSTPADPSVAKYLADEAALKLAEPATWLPFVRRVDNIRKTLPELVRSYRAAGKRVIGYGASAKGSTLLNTCGLTKDDLDYIIDNTPFKQGKVAPGSWIPIRPPGTLLEDQPDYALLLAWNFAPEIIRREGEYQERGGRFIVPIPEPKVIDFNGQPGH